MEEIEVKEFKKDNIQIIIEMPKTTHNSDKNIIEDIKYIMNNEALLQLSK